MSISIDALKEQLERLKSEITQFKHQSEEDLIHFARQHLEQAERLIAGLRPGLPAISNTDPNNRNNWLDSAINDVQNAFSSGFSTDFERVEEQDEDEVLTTTPQSVMPPIENREPDQQLCADVAKFFGIEESRR